MPSGEERLQALALFSNPQDGENRAGPRPDGPRPTRWIERKGEEPRRQQGVGRDDAASYGAMGPFSENRKSVSINPFPTRWVGQV